MLKPSRSHQDYVTFVCTRLATEKEPVRHLPAKAKLLLLDLTLAIPILALLYATEGRPVIPPEDLFRSLIAMLLCGITSIDTWVAQMRADPFYAIISGFAPTQVPGVGTFYEFIDRLLGLDAHRIKHLYRPKPRQRRAKKDKQASKDKNKDTPKHTCSANCQHIVAKLAAHFLRQAKPPAASTAATWRCDPAKFARAEQVIQAIFYACVVSKSIALGLIDLQHLCVAGDGSKFRTWANPNGRKQCQCDNKGKPPEEWCNCERYYRDPTARWGYDTLRVTIAGSTGTRITNSRPIRSTRPLNSRSWFCSPITVGTIPCSASSRCIKPATTWVFLSRSLASTKPAMP